MEVLKVNYKIESYDPQSGCIRVAYSSTEEVVSIYSYDLPTVDGIPPTEKELDQMIRARAPAWRLAASAGGDSSAPSLLSLDLGLFVHPIGTRPTLEDCKASKIAQIRKFRDALLCSAVSYRGKSYSTATTQLVYLNAIATLTLAKAEIPAELDLPNSANDLVPLGSEDVLGLLQAIAHHAMDVFQKAAQKELRVASAKTEKEVSEVTWIESGVEGGVLQGNLFITSGPSHQTYETEIAVDRVVIQ